MSLRAFLERIAAPGYSSCQRCHRPWRFVEPRIVQLDDFRGVFALCIDCWSVCSILARLRLHEECFARLGRSTSELAEIAAAVEREAS